MVRVDVLSSRERVLSAICDLKAKGEPFTILDIAERARCSRATTCRALLDLKHAQHVQVIPSRGRGGPNQYEVMAS